MKIDRPNLCSGDYRIKGDNLVCRLSIRQSESHPFLTHVFSIPLHVLDLMREELKRKKEFDLRSSGK